MKPLFFLLALLPVIGYSQECTIKKTVDPYSHETKLSTGFAAIGGGMDRFYISIDATKTDIDFIFSLNKGKEGKCFTDASSLVLTYEGGKLKSTLRNSGAMNCEGSFTLNFKNASTMASALKNLSTKKLIGLRFTGNNKEVTEIMIPEKFQETILKMTNCLLTEAKTLLQ